MDAGTTVAKLSNEIKRGSSPTYGCDQCHDWDSFKYIIYDPPTVECKCLHVVHVLQLLLGPPCVQSTHASLGLEQQLVFLYLELVV
jgi:hypothetical protein